MTDIDELKERIDLREWVEHDLGQAPVRRGHGERAWCFRCPFHDEHNGASLVVYKTYWKCYGACGDSGDALTWVARRHGLHLDQGDDFRKVVGILGGDLDRTASDTRQQRSSAKGRPPVPEQPPGEAWQARATELVERAERYLWSSGGRTALAYLLQRRGLTEHTIRTARLGYVPAADRRWRVEENLLIPTHSITLPWFAGNALWGVKCRRLQGDEPRYVQFTTADGHETRLGKGNLEGALYWVDHIVRHQPILIVEGEFNCLAAWEAAGDLVSPVSLGTSGQALNVRWFASLLTAPLILAWFDADRAGQGGVNRLVGLAHYIQQLRLPSGSGKDLNDFWCMSQTQGDPEAMRRWLTVALSLDKK